MSNRLEDITELILFTVLGLAFVALGVVLIMLGNNFWEWYRFLGAELGRKPNYILATNSVIIRIIGVVDILGALWFLVWFYRRNWREYQARIEVSTIK